MPRKDSIHEAVKNALIKEDWVITHDPLFIEYGLEDMYVDLGAERLLGAQKDSEKIAVEIKSFAGTSTITELHNALGQYQVYLAVLEKIDPDRKLFLALSESSYQELSSMSTFELVTTRFGVALLVVSVDIEEIFEWKK